MTYGEFHKMFIEQDTKCVVCKKTYTERLGSWMEYNGEKKGLVCEKCNAEILL
jgi:DNA-directed RNA polymerase subunit RPC12/RpoP